MKYRRIPKLLVFIVLALSLTMTVSAASYSDTSGHWAESVIERWTDLGLVNGYDNGKFGPTDSISRGQLAAMLNSLMQYGDTAKNTYGLDETAWYTPYILKAVSADILPDAWGAELAPTQALTREEAIYIIAKAFCIADSAVSPNQYYAADGGKVSSWAAGAVSAMTERGYVGGYGDGVLGPQDPFNRAQVVQILNNLCTGIYTTAGTYTTSVDGNAVILSSGVTLSNATINGDVIITGAAANGSVLLKNLTVTGEIYNMGDAVVRVLDNDRTSGGVLTYKDEKLPIHTNVSANTYSADLFTTGANGYLTYNSDYYDTVIGIDVSAHQGDIDWQAVANSGVKFAMIRVGFRGYTAGTLNLDQYFEANIQGALDAGLDVGVYFFSQAITVAEAQEEADFVLNAIKGYDVTYPVVYDWETISGTSVARTKDMDASVLNQCAKAFCDRVTANGYDTSVYFYTWLGYKYYDLSQLADYDFWYAEYSAAPTFYYDFQMWQYTSSGTVPGIKGKVDIDILFRK